MYYRFFLVNSENCLILNLECHLSGFIGQFYITVVYCTRGVEIGNDANNQDEQHEPATGYSNPNADDKRSIALLQVTVVQPNWT